MDFQSPLPQHYPQLSMLIETQNLTMLKNRTKLILLGNGFFDDPVWNFAFPGQTSFQMSKDQY